jgi:hypothetical protein
LKAGDKQSNRLIEISVDVGIRREMEDSKSVPFSLLVGKNEPPVRIGSHTQPIEPIGEKNRITRMALERAGYASLRKEGKEL